MRGVVTLVVVASLLVAGCGGVAEQDQPGIEETVTPAPVPSTTPQAETDYPPGVSADRVDADVVALEHYRALAEASYTQTTTVRWQSSNGTTYLGRTVIRASGDSGRYVFSHEYPRPRGSMNRSSFDVWYDGDQSFVRATFDEGSAEQQVYDRRTHNTDAASPLVRDLFSRLTVERVVRTDDGSTVVQGSLSRIGRMNGPRHSSGTANATMSARVHSDGYVDRIAVGYDATVNESTVRVREETTVSAVGETTVTEPAWVGNETSSTD